MQTVSEKLDALKLVISTRSLSRAGTNLAMFNADEDPETPEARLSNAALLAELTGKCRDITLEYPLDIQKKEDTEQINRLMEDKKLNPATLAVNPLVARRRGVLNHRLMYGTLSSPYPEVRVASINSILGVLQLMRDINCRQILLWIPDGADSPGEKNIVEMLDLILKGMRQIGIKIRKSENMLLTFKPYNPSFFCTAVPDWGTAAWLCRETDPSCRLLFDTGSLLPGESLDSVIVSLLHQKILGRVAVSDNRLGMGTLPAGSLDAGAMFRFFLNLLSAERAGLCSLDKLPVEIKVESRVGDPMENLLTAVENTLHALARAALVNPDELKQMQEAPDLSGANRILRDAFVTDVRPVVQNWRETNNLPVDPISEYRGRSKQTQ
jgi:L-rhamnose isomerase/sugar isomerase